jgi:hypothetical protein
LGALSRKPVLGILIVSVDGALPVLLPVDDPLRLLFLLAALSGAAAWIDSNAITSNIESPP